MNEQMIISNLILFVEERERLLQRRRLLADQKAKNDTIKAIIDKLEAEIHENQ